MERIKQKMTVEGIITEKPWVGEWLDAFSRDIPGHEGRFYSRKLMVTFVKVNSFNPKGNSALSSIPKKIALTLEEIIGKYDPEGKNIVEKAPLYGGVMFSEGLTKRIIEELYFKDLLAESLNELIAQRAKIFISKKQEGKDPFFYKPEKGTRFLEDLKY